MAAGLRRARGRGRWLGCLVVLLLLPAAGTAGGLEEDLGRNEVRVRSAPWELRVGVDPVAAGLPDRLERLGYDRVRGRRPERPGEYFWGYERFWVHRREHEWGGRRWPASLLRLDLGSDGRIVALLDGEGRPPGSRDGPWLEPELLAESLAADRARRLPVRLDALPEHVWQPLLAAEDARFFEHRGLDGRALARALLANLEAGGIAQGGSTISQQLIKMRDLTPKRTLGRKVSEAVRTLELEAEYTKEEILEAYLNHVYLGHRDGVAIHGYGAAARAWFGKQAHELDLAEAAALAAMVQAPNRLDPADRPEELRRRRDWVLGRLVELEWASSSEVAAAQRRPVDARSTPPPPMGPGPLLATLERRLAELAPRRSAEERGVVVETTIDPWLQSRVEGEVETALDRLERRLRSRPQAAVLVLAADDGRALAWVGGDPAARSSWDRVSRARRQPGSTVKPFVLLEAIERCGGRRALYPARRIVDAPFELELSDGPWRPRNSDGEFRGVVTLREATDASLNVPFVRVARWCGFEATAGRFRTVGLSLPATPPPSFVLGSVEVTPLELAAAYSVLALDGRQRQPWVVERWAAPSGRTLADGGPELARAARTSSAFLVRELLRGPATRALGSDSVAGSSVFGKTGTSSERRDAWLAGGAGGVLAVVWVGFDDGRPLGLSGAEAAAPLWAAVVEAAAPTLPPHRDDRPRGVVERRIQSDTGLLVRRERADSEVELFRRGRTPPQRRWYRPDDPLPPIE